MVFCIFEMVFCIFEMIFFVFLKCFFFAFLKYFCIFEMVFCESSSVFRNIHETENNVICGEIGKKCRGFLSPPFNGNYIVINFRV